MATVVETELAQAYYAMQKAEFAATHEEAGIYIDRLRDDVSEAREAVETALNEAIAEGVKQDG